MEYIKIYSNNPIIEDDLGRTIQLGTQFSDHLKITIDDLLEIPEVDEYITAQIENAEEEIKNEIRGEVEELETELKNEKEWAKRLEAHNEELAARLNEALKNKTPKPKMKRKKK